MTFLALRLYFEPLRVELAGQAFDPGLQRLDLARVTLLQGAQTLGQLGVAVALGLQQFVQGGHTLVHLDGIDHADPDRHGVDRLADTLQRGGDPALQFLYLVHCPVPRDDAPPRVLAHGADESHPAASSPILRERQKRLRGLSPQRVAGCA